jgi:hypothetical protein
MTLNTPAPRTLPPTINQRRIAIQCQFVSDNWYNWSYW